MSAPLRRELTVISAAVLVVSNMVGTGIFTTTGYLAGDLGRPALVLGIWVAGAVVALAGCLSYAELGINLPRSGGEYVYLREAWGPAWGFLSGWVSFFAGFAAPVAAGALAFFVYFGRLLPPYFNEFIAINFAHRCGAIVVSVLVIWTVARVLRAHRDAPHLYRTAMGLGVLLVVQIFLGALTIWSGRAVIPTTSHVAIGAAVLATSLALTVRAYHIYGLPGGAAARARDERTVAGHGVSA